MSDTPAVTVLMPVYNADRFVAQTVNTIITQTIRVGSAAYLQPTEILAARIARLGVKYRF